MARTEVRKECPSCGLGVSLDAKVCEFCGWDFEEEDEWISQIEQLEQELITERKKFDDTNVDRMIKATLRSPVEMEEVKQKPRTVKRRVTAKKKEPRPPTEPVDKMIQDEISAPVAEEELAIPPPPEQVEAEAKAKQTGRVRRVVSRPAQPKPSTERKPMVRRHIAPSGPERKSSPKAALERPPAKPPKTTKKGMFGGLGDMFSVTVPTDQKPHVAGGTKKRALPSKKGAVAAMPEKRAPTATEKSPVPPKKESPREEGEMVRVFVCPLCKAEVSETETKCPSCGAEFA